MVRDARPEPQQRQAARLGDVTGQAHSPFHPAGLANGVLRRKTTAPASALHSRPGLRLRHARTARPPCGTHTYLPVPLPASHVARTDDRPRPRHGTFHPRRREHPFPPLLHPAGDYPRHAPTTSGHHRRPAGRIYRHLGHRPRLQAQAPARGDTHAPGRSRRGGTGIHPTDVGAQAR